MRDKKYDPISDIKDRNYILTGSTGYLGGILLKFLIQNDCNLILPFRHNSQFEKNIISERVDAVEVDLSILKELDLFIEYVKAKYEFIDGIIYMTNFTEAPNFTEDLDFETFLGFQKLNTFLPYSLTMRLRTLLSKKSLLSNKTSSVINVSSIYSLLSPKLSIYSPLESINNPMYGASKASMNQVGRFLANYLAADRIRVNNLILGPFPSTKTQQSDPDLIENLSNIIPLGRIGDEKDLIGPVCFLLSEMSSFLTGSSVVVDGGWSST